MTFDQQIIAIAMVILGTVITRLVPFIFFFIQRENASLYSLPWESSHSSYFWINGRL